MITTAMIPPLRAQVCARLGETRFAHTRGVEETAAQLAQWFAPEEEPLLRAAALLHDVTKELSEQEQRFLLAKDNIRLSPEEDAIPALFHSLTAPYVIRRDFPAYAEDAVLSAVRNHTVGRPEMTLTEKIIFISDYIEPTRTYPACLAVRNALLPALETAEPKERLSLLNRAVLQAMDNTIASLRRKNLPIAAGTFAARNAIQDEISRR